MKCTCILYHCSVPSDDSSEKFAYNIYGAAVSEVELDVLTGQSEILRVDILYDCGMR